MNSKLYILIICLFFYGCAQIIAPSGGEKDTTPPSLEHAEILENSKNLNQKTIVLKFDEYIQLNKWDEYFYVSPPLEKINTTIHEKDLSIIIEDNLIQNGIYHFSLNLCVKDNNEGNVLDSLNFQLNQNNSVDTFTFSGILKEAYTLKFLNNAWVMLFSDTIKDSLIFKEPPLYVSKTDEKGRFHFPNLKDFEYTMIALTGLDFFYESAEKIGFLDENVCPSEDVFLSVFAFDPEYQINRADSLVQQVDSIISNYYNKDSIVKTDNTSLGKLEITSDAPPNCIFQLLQEEKVIREAYFTDRPYIIDNIVAGRYNLKYIEDANQDSVWTTGNWHNKLQPEKVVNYPEEIIIRFNWDLNLDWIIGE